MSGLRIHVPAVRSDGEEEMARRRPNTTLVHIEAGHAIYYDNLDEYVKVIQSFLKNI